MEIFQGVYKITNMLDGKVYIGSSINIYKRWNQHKNELRKNKHYNNYLQEAWNESGEVNFKFEIIALIKEIDMVLIIEEVYIEKYECNVSDIGYNISKTTTSNHKNKPYKEVEVTSLNKANSPCYTVDRNITLKNLSLKTRGRNNKGEIVLTNKDVIEISLLLHNGISIHEIQEEYNVGDAAIRRIKVGKVWEDIIQDIDYSFPLPNKLIKIIEKIKNKREKPKSKKLTSEQANSIRKLLKNENLTQKQIAEQLDVTLHQVKGVSRNRYQYSS